MSRYAGVFAFLSLLLVALLVVIEVEAQQITSLPGYNDSTPISQYSGYITVNQTHGRALFYWLIESLNDPDNAPLVVWFQGGPGCSSLFGLFIEHGPFRPNAQGGLDYNPVNWALVANMLYVEAPAGVGFSYSNTSSDYNTNDAITAQDNYAFLQGFLQEYPQYQGRQTWIAGESYGGVYVPTLVQQIINGPDSALSKQLQGFMVGNPVLGCFDRDQAMLFNVFYWHGLISYSNYHNWTENLCDTEAPPNRAYCDDLYNITQTEVGDIFQQATGAAPLPLPSLDPDDLYQDFCTGNGSLAFSENLPTETGQCISIDELLFNYLNQPDVQEAIHVFNAPVQWSACSSIINYTVVYHSVLPIYLEFFKQRPDLDILVYSGDVDVATVPFAMTQKCLWDLQRPIKNKWQPWYVNEATAGYFEDTDRFTFATLKGAGHEAPAYQTLNAYNLFSRFLKDQNLKSEVRPSRTHKIPRQSSILRRVLSQGDVRV
eukprot:TRINITY_DN18891_c0_g1_i1.p1 TRINITY_DN18891_c0_g1~~TRINITY_DN18891_c0_g1_i1.p1  ORF type:complete len:487 (+),score=66.30 TRINITY_DN18891_c0_g1_i1:3-1463(+)